MLLLAKYLATIRINTAGKVNTNYRKWTPAIKILNEKKKEGKFNNLCFVLKYYEVEQRILVGCTLRRSFAQLACVGNGHDSVKNTFQLPI